MVLSALVRICLSRHKWPNSHHYLCWRQVYLICNGILSLSFCLALLFYFVGLSHARASDDARIFHTIFSATFWYVARAKISKNSAICLSTYASSAWAASVKATRVRFGHTHLSYRTPLVWNNRYNHQHRNKKKPKKTPRGKEREIVCISCIFWRLEIAPSLTRKRQHISR